MRLQVCTLTSTSVILSAQTETTALLQQVLTMLQQGPIRERSRRLSMHSQVEPAGFNSQTTRVRCYPRLSVHTNGCHSQVVASTTPSTGTFSILSPDLSLSYDRIKLRLEEYRALLASDSDTIELSTENGKTIIFRKQANEMEEYLDQAEILLRDVVQSRDISTIVVLHHLCDLSKVLDKMELPDECRLTGSTALCLAEALGRWSLEFRHEQAETLALIAGLSVYRSSARDFFSQAISICEAVVANNPSHTNKNKLLLVLNRAGHWASDHLRAQWLGHAVHIMTKELPSTMVRPHFRTVIYHNYGNGLRQLKQYSSALEAYHEAISICRTLIDNNPAKYNLYLAQTLVNTGVALRNLRKYDGAIAAYKEALEICTTMSDQYSLQYDELMAKTLYNYGITLGRSNRISEAAAVEEQAIKLFRELARAGNEWTTWLCSALSWYGSMCGSLGQHVESVLAYQESILRRRPLAASDSREARKLINTLHAIAYSFLALGRYAEGHTAANEVLKRNHGRALEVCPHAPNFHLCFVCSRAMITDSVGNDLPPIPCSLDNSPPRPVEYSGAGAFHTPSEISISSPSAYIPPPNTASQLGFGQPGAVSEALIPVHLDPTAPSLSYPPFNQPHFQGLIDSITPPPKRNKILGLFRRSRGQWKVFSIVAPCFTIPAKYHSSPNVHEML